MTPILPTTTPDLPSILGFTTNHTAPAEGRSRRPRLRIPLYVVIWTVTAVFASVSPCSAQDDEFKRLKSLFTAKSLELDDQLAARKFALLQNYATAIDGIQRSFQEAGNLEGVVSAKSESDSARSGALTTLKNLDSLPVEMRRLRELAEKEIEKQQSEHNSSLRDLRTKLITALESLKTSYTKEGEVDTALAVAAEIANHNALLTGSAPFLRQSLSDLPEDLQKGLILWFPFDEEAEATVTDLSPKAMQGVVKGTQFAKDGRIGGARSFNGIDDRIEIAGQLPDAERFTISVWIKTPGNAGKGGIFCDYNGVAANDLLYSLVGNEAIYIRADKSGKTLNAEVKLPEKLTTEWHHLVWVAGQRDSTLYIDQKPVGKVREEGSNVGFHTAFIGYSISDQGRRNFEGLLDEFMMWDRALTHGEVEELGLLGREGQ